MLENWSVTNFKSIPKTRVITSDGTETGTLDLKPLTVLCGANSSGKSSLLQSILLIAQTMRNRDKEFPIVLNGDYTGLGTFDNIKTFGSEGGEIGIGFTYRPESHPLINENEYPFNHIWAEEDKSSPKEAFEEWKEKLHKEAEVIEDEGDGEPYRIGAERSKNSENKFRIDAISFELYFSSLDEKEKTKILPILIKAVFSVRFYQQKKVGKKYTNDEGKGAYILKWNISELKDNGVYNFKESVELPDGTVADIREKELFPFEVTNHGAFRFQEKLPDQYILKIYEKKCVFNHFFPEEMKIEIDIYLDFLYLLFCLGCYDSKEVARKIKDKLKMAILAELLEGEKEGMSISPDIKKYLNKPVDFDLFDSIIIPDSIYAYVKNHILQGIKSAEDLLESFEYNDLLTVEENLDHVHGLEEDELLDIEVEPHSPEEEYPFDYIAHPGYLFDGSNWKNSLDKLDNEKKELIYQRLYDDTNRIAIFARYMFWRWEVCVKSCSDPGEFLSDDVSYFIMDKLSRIFDCFSKSVYYLGPLREDPRSLYPYPNNDDSFDLGRKGEHTASVLFLHGEKKSNFPLPGQKENEVKTIEAIKQWLAYIGVADDIKTELDSGIALKIQTPESPKWSDLTNVGVGVSQVIPIVAMCLTAPKGTTLVIEQPELHLHPKMQTRLAEFFMAIADSGVQCIIETHSEHFINAMRLNIASDDLGKEKMIDKSIIYFVEKIQNSSIFREIKINDLGIIPHWPKDFFDEDINQTDKIILASSKKRAQKFSEDEEMDDE